MIRRLLMLWRNLAHRARVDRDLDEELDAAFDLLVEEKRRMGLGAEAAHQAARVEMGRVDLVKARVRDVRAGAALDALAQDLGYGARLLRRNPLFAATAVLSLAIGIGANTTIFTIANALLFRAPAGVADPGRVIDISRFEEGHATANFTTSYPYYLDVRDRATTLAGVFAFEFEPRPINLGLTEGVEAAFANLVTVNYFTGLGVAAATGRLLDRRDSDEPGRSPVAVISHRFWVRRFNRDPGIVGRTVRVNRHPFTVVGVAAEGFRGTNVVTTDLWAPMGMVGAVQPDSARLTRRDSDGLGIGARLKPGMSMARAAAELDAIAVGIEREHAEDRGTLLRVAGLSSVPGRIATLAASFFALLVALVAIVLAIACANLAGVLLARATARAREMAVRAAIGAGRARLVRQLLTETLMLFALGGAAGLLVARGLTSLVLKLLPAFAVPIDFALPLDGRVVAFTAGLSLVAAVVSGLAPALHVSKADVVTALKDEAQGPAGRQRVRHAFVIAQVAFSLVLVVVASVLVQALGRVSVNDRGFDSEGIETASLDLSRAGYTPTAAAAFARDLIERLGATTAVEAATLAAELPGRTAKWVGAVTVPGVVPENGQTSFVAIWRRVDTAYFATLRIPLVSGREFDERDRPGAEPVTVVAETTARRLWPGRDPIGQFMVRGQIGGQTAEPSTRLKVIGVARDQAASNRSSPRSEIRHRGADGSVVSSGEPLSLYVPLQQQPSLQLTILARAAAGGSIAPHIRDAVRALDANLPAVTIGALDARTGAVELQLAVAASVAGSVGLVGLVLAAIGIYGVTAYSMARRTREIGIRVVMGARRADVVMMVLRQGIVLVGIGMALGLLLAAASTRLLAGMFSMIPPLDPVSLAGAAVLFTLVGLMACYVPVRRAVRVEAMDALRYE